jgi:hypothetical protein
MKFTNNLFLDALNKFVKIYEDFQGWDHQRTSTNSILYLVIQPFSNTGTRSKKILDLAQFAYKEPTPPLSSYTVNLRRSYLMMTKREKSSPG